MTVFDIFSKRQKLLRGDTPDVYTYTTLPKGLRVQIVHIWKDALGDKDQYDMGRGGVRSAYDFVFDGLCREYGVFDLPGSKSVHTRTKQAGLIEYLLAEPNVDRALDAVELSFRMIDRATRQFSYLSCQDAAEVADGAIAELNARFNEHGIGFQYSDGEIIRVDSQLIHAEVVKPALRLLNQKRYSGAQDEYLKAHEHYREGNTKEALNECLKAFESVMKSICDERKWKYATTSTAKDLLQVCFDNHLVPPYWQSSFTALRTLLESSVPTGRNKLGGHGQGATPTQVPGYVASYMLHMTAAAIVFLAEADAAMG